MQCDEQSREFDPIHVYTTDELPMVNIWNLKTLDPELREFEKHRQSTNSDEQSRELDQLHAFKTDDLPMENIWIRKTLDPELQEIDEDRKSTNSAGDPKHEARKELDEQSRGLDLFHVYTTDEKLQRNGKLLRQRTNSATIPEGSLHVYRSLRSQTTTPVIEMSVVPASFFPRYEFALENLRDIIQRYPNVFRSSQNSEPLWKNVAIYFCKPNQESNFPLRLDDLVSHDVDTKLVSVERIHLQNNCLQTENSSAFSIFVVTDNMKDIISKANKFNALIVILARSKREANAISKRYSYRSKDHVLIIRKETAEKQIETYLEQAIFHVLSPFCETLHKHLERIRFNKRHESTVKSKRKKVSVTNVQYKRLKRDKTSHLEDSGTDIMQMKTKANQDRNEKTLSEDDYKTMVVTKPATRQNVLQRKRNKDFQSSVKAKRKKQQILTNLPKGNNQQLLTLFEVNEEVFQNVHEQTKECLLEELLGLYNMSDVPDIIRPKIPNDRENNDLEEVRKDIFAADPSITGVGYRYGKLQIFVEKITGQYKRLSQKIRQVLAKHDMEEFEIMHMSFKKFLSVGDEICVGASKASFGCFAEMQEDTGPKLCGLLSKHVATGSDEVCVKDGDQLMPVGRILKETVTEQGLDIAAARLNINQSRSTCDTQFRSSGGSPRKTGRDRFNSTDRLKGHKVHLWGAKSKPGKGIITDTDFKYKGMDYSLIQVEDVTDGNRKIAKRFAQPGDSGAVTCADDPDQERVHPISMNMGCCNYEDVEKDDVKEVRGRYLTVPLTSGLEELHKRTGKTFYLY